MHYVVSYFLEMEGVYQYLLIWIADSLRQLVMVVYGLAVPVQHHAINWEIGLDVRFLIAKY